MRHQPDFAAFAAAAAASSKTVTAIEYRPEEACFYSGEDPVNLMRQVPELGVLSISLRTPWPSLDDLDPYRCNLFFRALSLAPRDEVAYLFRYVLDQVSIVSLPASVLFGDGKAEKSPGSSAAADRSPVQEVALRIALEQLSILALPGNESEQEKRLASVTSILPNILAALGDDKLTQNFAAACEENTPASMVAFINELGDGLER